VSCCQVYTLIRLTIDSNLRDYTQIWVTLSHCSHSVELQLHNTEMITKWSDDYLVVVSYVNQCWLDTFACLE
jgi:hypothetical protein